MRKSVFQELPGLAAEHRKSKKSLATRSMKKDRSTRPLDNGNAITVNQETMFTPEQTVDYIEVFVDGLTVCFDKNCLEIQVL